MPNSGKTVTAQQSLCACMQVDDLVMLSGCCADDGTFLDKIWSPMIRPTVERIEVRGNEGVWMQEMARKSSGSQGANISARH